MVVRKDVGEGKNGGIIHWIEPKTESSQKDVVIFEWNEDYLYGSHYHALLAEWGNKHIDSFGNEIPHYFAGEEVPEPWDSLYFYG